MDLIEAFRLGWREAATHHRMVNMFEPIDQHANITEPTDDEIRQIIRDHSHQEQRPARPPEPHELSELSIG